MSTRRDYEGVPEPGRYPGLGLPLRYWPEQGGAGKTVYPMGSHPNFWGAESDMVQVREVAMMMIMDRLTDKKDWHIKVFDDEIVAKWRAEAMEIPDLDLFKLAMAPGSRWKSLIDPDDKEFEPGSKWDANNIRGILSEEAFGYVRRAPSPPFSAFWKRH